MRWAVAGLIVLAVLTVAAYGPTRAASFVYEDAVYLGGTDGRTLHNATQWLLYQPWKPSRKLTEWTWTLTGPDPVRAHGLSLLIHLANGLLLFWVVRRFAGVGWSLCATGLLWLHPLAVEAVAYAAGRGDLLVTLGCLLALAGVLRVRRPWMAWPVMLAGLFVAWTGKESGVVVLPLGAAALWLRWGRAGRLLLACGAACGAVLAVRVVPVALHAVNASIAASAGYRDGLAWSWWGWALVQMGAAGLWLWHLVMPVGLSVEQDAVGLSVAVPVLACVAFAVMLVLAYRVRHTQPAVVLGLLAWIARNVKILKKTLPR